MLPWRVQNGPLLLMAWAWKGGDWVRRSYGYNSYRGRVTFQGFLRGLIIVLAVILILALVGYFLLQRYVVYTDQGQKFRFPFLAGEKDPSPSESVQIVVGGQESVSPEPTVSPVEEQPLQAVWLPLTALAQGRWRSRYSPREGMR